MTDREICERIVENGACFFEKHDCDICHLHKVYGFKCDSITCVLYAKQWLANNPEPLSDIPNWDDLPWVMGLVNGSGDKWIKCKVLYKKSVYLCATSWTTTNDCIFCIEIKPYIETITMEIPVDITDDVNELIEKHKKEVFR